MRVRMCACVCVCVCVSVTLIHNLKKTRKKKRGGHFCLYRLRYRNKKTRGKKRGGHFCAPQLRDPGRREAPRMFFDFGLFSLVFQREHSWKIELRSEPRSAFKKTKRGKKNAEAKVV